MGRALGVGIAATVVGIAVFALLGRLTDWPAGAAWGAWIAVGIAGFLVSWRAPRRKVAMGMLIAPVNAAIVALLAAIESARGGSTDFPGLRGAIAVFQLYTLTSAIPAFAGSLAAYLLARARKRRLSKEDPGGRS